MDSTSTTENLVPSNVTHNWPSYFPNNVPPVSAYPPSSVFYRITNKTPPSNRCVLSEYQKNPDSLTELDGLHLICAYALSLQSTLEGAKIAVGRFKNSLRKRYIAKASLDGNVGVIMQTFQDNNHHTLWAFDKVEVHTLFQCVEVIRPQ